jgi:hypothetical protein
MWSGCCEKPLEVDLDNDLGNTASALNPLPSHNGTA